MNRGLRPVMVAVALLLHVGTAEAHTLAGTKISVRTVRTETLTVAIEAEADPLIVKLEALAGIVRSDQPATQAERRARLESLFPTLRANIEARVNDHPLDLTLQSVAVDDTAQVEIRMTGTLTGGPQLFTWRSTFIFGAYQVATTSGDAAEVIEWLQGPQTSTPIALEPSRADVEPSALRSTGIRVLHSLAMGVLVVYVLHRRRSAQRLAGR